MSKRYIITEDQFKSIVGQLRLNESPLEEISLADESLNDSDDVEVKLVKVEIVDQTTDDPTNVDYELLFTWDVISRGEHETEHAQILASEIPNFQFNPQEHVFDITPELQGGVADGEETFKSIAFPESVDLWVWNNAH